MYEHNSLFILIQLSHIWIPKFNSKSKIVEYRGTHARTHYGCKCPQITIDRPWFNLFSLKKKKSKSKVLEHRAYTKVVSQSKCLWIALYILCVNMQCQYDTLCCMIYPLRGRKKCLDIIIAYLYFWLRLLLARQCCVSCVWLSAW